MNNSYEEMEIDGETKSTGEVEKKEMKGIMVIMMGAPGSGKSTFCDHIIRHSARPWVRVCQDTIGNGKAGTKIQCLSSAGAALKDGKNVFIDRCNLDREQRAEFLKLGGSHQVDVHAVVLDLPAKLCISRSVKRSAHEGNLQGGKAAAVVNRMLQKKELPKLNEGFCRITICQNESDVEAAMNTYSKLGPSDVLPSGCFGQKNPDAKVQQGIMKFLKKVDAPSKATPDTNVSQESIANQVATEKVSLVKETAEKSALTGHGDIKMKDDDAQEMGYECSPLRWDSVPTLAFPSISTADFQFSLEKASEIIIEKVEEFVNIIGNARLIMVDLSSKSKILSLVRSKASMKNIDPNKFFTIVGDITCLHSKGGLNCNVLANAANWRLKPGGGGVNAAIFSAAGPDLDTATKQRAGSLTPGKSVVVPLPTSSPLFNREGVTHIIHVLGPNMNPQRPNCLNNDYVKGCKILRDAYSSLFESFASIVKTQDKLSEKTKSMELELHDHGKQHHVKEFTNCDQKVKRDYDYESERNKKCKGSINELGCHGKDSMRVRDIKSTEGSSQSMSKGWGTWAQALYKIAMQPEKHKNEVLEISDDIVVLNDGFPKAKRHLLVLTRAEGLDRLVDIRGEHLQLLRAMHAVGLKWAEKFIAEDESLIFRLGYHSVPSMRQLHLHVVSQDFDSSYLKHKKHWNSFNTSFFLDSVDVIKEVSEHGKATLKDDEKLLSMELRCHRCKSAHPNIPRLKSHISNCRATFPASLLQNGRLVSASGKGTC